METWKIGDRVKCVESEEGKHPRALKGMVGTIVEWPYGPRPNCVQVLFDSRRSDDVAGDCAVETRLLILVPTETGTIT